MEVFVPISSACLSGNIVRMEEGEEQKNGVGDGDLMMMTGHDDDSFSSFLSWPGLKKNLKVGLPLKK